MTTPDDRAWYERVRPVFEAVCAVQRDQWDRVLAEQELIDPDAAAEVRRLLHGKEPATHDPELSRAWSALLGRVEQTAAPRSPDRIGPYRILGPIDRGGMGEVFLAQQEDGVQLRVALKVMQDWLHGDRATARFRQEQEALARLNHPYIAKVHYADVTDAERPYFAMELVEGALPITAFADRAAMDLRARLLLFQKVCAGVHYAHQKAVVHCDLKPGNILVTEQSGEAVPKIIDFGLARLRDPGMVGSTTIGGTLEYMAPEQARGDRDAIDVRSDVHALGVVAYELVVGVLPITSAELRAVDLITAVRTIERRVAELPSRRLARDPERRRLLAGARRSSSVRLLGRIGGELDWIIMKALAKEPDRRYASPRDLADDIERYLTAQPIEARPPSRTYHVRKFVQRHAAAVAMLTALFVGLAGALVSVNLARASEREESARSAMREARLAMRNAEWPAAMAALDRAIDLGHPDPTDLILDKIECFEAMQQPVASLRLLRSVPEGVSPPVEARRLMLLGMLGADRLADPAAGSVEMRQALAMHEAALAAGQAGLLSPAAVEYLHGMLADDFTVLLEHMREAVRLDPFHLMANCELVGVEMLRGDATRAAMLCAAAKGRWPSFSWFAFFEQLAGVAAGTPGGLPPERTDAAEDLIVGVVHFFRALDAYCSVVLENWVRLLFNAEPTGDWAQMASVVMGAKGLADSVGKLTRQGSMESWHLTRMSAPVRRAFEPALRLRPLLGSLLLPARRADACKDILRQLEETPASQLDGMVLLFRVAMRSSIDQATLAWHQQNLDDLEHADSGVLRLLPSMRRMVCFLRMASLRALMHATREGDPARESLRRQSLQVAAALAELPRLSSLEVQLHAKFLADDFGEVGAAERILRVGHRNDPHAIHILSNLAIVVERSGRPAEARAWWRRFLAEVPDDPRALEQLRRLDQGSEPSGTGK
ncbi:MAG: serine/threonine protein kinase [Planctomycetes bacterium]|nr:serine/threonine protein kinase [Planctomycetota bacterium]